MKLILNPEEYPRHWAVSLKANWFIKRSKPNAEGLRAYTCHYSARSTNEEKTIHIQEKYLLWFIAKFEKVASVSRIELMAKGADGKLYNILNAPGNESDASRYGEETMRRAA